MESFGSEFEEQFVKQTYNEIAYKFSSTRHKVWPIVANYIASLDPQSTIFEAGCGNGKNILLRPDKFVGLDSSEEFVKICKERNLNVIQGDICDLPFETNQFDHSICVAVLHHLSTPERRTKAVSELARVTSKSVFIEVWAYELYPFRSKDKICGSEQDRMIPFNSGNGVYDRFYHFFTKQEIIDLVNSCGLQITQMYEESDNWIVIASKN